MRKCTTFKCEIQRGPPLFTLRLISFLLFATRLPDALEQLQGLTCCGSHYDSTHPLQQVGPEYGHEDEDAEEAQAADEQQDLREISPQPVPLEGVLHRGCVGGLQELQVGVSTAARNDRRTRREDQQHVSR